MVRNQRNDTAPCRAAMDIAASVRLVTIVPHRWWVYVEVRPVGAKHGVAGSLVAFCGLASKVLAKRPKATAWQVGGGMIARQCKSGSSASG